MIKYGIVTDHRSPIEVDKTAKDHVIGRRRQNVYWTITRRHTNISGKERLCLPNSKADGGATDVDLARRKPEAEDAICAICAYQAVEIVVLAADGLLGAARGAGAIRRRGECERKTTCQFAP